MSKLEIACTFINSVFKLEGKHPPFSNKHNTKVETTKVNNEIGQVLKCLNWKLDRVQQMEKCLAEAKIKNCKTLSSFDRKDLTEVLTAVGNGLGFTDTFAAGEVVEILMTAQTVEETNTTSASTGLLDIQNKYTDEAKQKDPVLAAITTVGDLLELIRREYDMDTTDLLAVMNGKEFTPKVKQNGIEKVVWQNITERSLTLDMTISQKYQNTGIELLKMVIIKMCSFTLRTVFARTKALTLPGQYKGDIRTIILQTQQNKVIADALANYRDYADIMVMLDDVEAAYPCMGEEVRRIFQLPHDTKPEVIYERLIKEFDHLQPNESNQEIFSTTDADDVVFRIDSGADHTILNSNQMSNSWAEQKTFGTMSTAFRTTEAGTLKGQVDNQPKPSYNKEEQGQSNSAPKKVPFDLNTFGTTTQTENLLSLETLYEHEVWQAITLTLNNGRGGGWLYGKNGIRVPIFRKEGGKGHYLKVHRK